MYLGYIWSAETEEALWWVNRDKHLKQQILGTIETPGAEDLQFQTMAYKETAQAQMK